MSTPGIRQRSLLLAVFLSLLAVLLTESRWTCLPYRSVAYYVAVTVSPGRVHESVATLCQMAAPCLHHFALPGGAWAHHDGNVELGLRKLPKPGSRESPGRSLLGARVQKKGVARASAASGRPAGMPPGFTMPGGGSAASNQGTTNQELYLPFRKPDVVPEIGKGLSIDEQLEILRERRGLWHEYAPLLTSLSRAGYTPSVIDEATGMNGVEQNTIVVATQVFSSLKASGVPTSRLHYFDAGGAEVLYELRTLSTNQRREAAEYVMENGLEIKEARELARCIKEHERRKRDEGHECFRSDPSLDSSLEIVLPRNR